MKASVIRAFLRPFTLTLCSWQRAFFSATSAPAAYAATGSDFDYPELLVTPKASERMASEAAKEPSSRWTS